MDAVGAVLAWPPDGEAPPESLLAPAPGSPGTGLPSALRASFLCDIASSTESGEIAIRVGGRRSMVCNVAESCEVVEEKEGAMDTRGRCGGCHVMHLRPVQT